MITSRMLVTLAAALTALRAQAPEAGQKPRFDVVSVKENTSGEAAMSLRTQGGGRFVATNVPLKQLIAAAFSMADSPETADERILGGPDWIGSMRVDIIARASSPFAATPDGPAPELLLMIQSLLEDRFQLRAHLESRELPVYQLVAARPDGRLGPELHPSSNCDAVMAAVRAGGAIPARQANEPPPCGAMGGPAFIIAGGLPMQQFAKRLTPVDVIVIDSIERPTVD